MTTRSDEKSCAAGSPHPGPLSRRAGREGDKGGAFAQAGMGYRCRACARQGVLPVLDLGMMPPSDGLVPPERFGQPEERFPLQLAFCPHCSLVQILETVDPAKLFGEGYLYYSSFSDALLAHARANALELLERRRLGRESLVVEVASNDGYLLRNFVERGVPVLGIDPAPGQAEAARKCGVPTLCEFFGRDLALRLRQEGQRADVIIGSNVLAHVADTNGFVAGLSLLLKDDGVVCIEAPYVRDLIDHGEFDTIYHEHLCYFSVTAVDAMFRRHGLYLNEVRRLSIHGGSLRYYFERREAPGTSVTAMLEEERRLGLDRYEYYRDFGRRTEDIKRRLNAMVSELKASGKRLAAYGAAAKGTILLNYVGLDHRAIDFVVDRNVHKHGKRLPGVGISIRGTEALIDQRPDCVLLLAWNFKEEILKQQQAYRDRGGRFIVPIPSPEMV